MSTKKFLQILSWREIWLVFSFKYWKNFYWKPLKVKIYLLPKWRVLNTKHVIKIFSHLCKYSYSQLGLLNRIVGAQCGNYWIFLSFTNLLTKFPWNEILTSKSCCDDFTKYFQERAIFRVFHTVSSNATKNTLETFGNNTYLLFHS